MRHQRQIALAIDRDADRLMRQRHPLDETRRTRRDVDHLNEFVDDEPGLVGRVDLVGRADQRQLLVRAQRDGERRRGDTVLDGNLAEELRRKARGIDYRQRVAERRIIDLVGTIDHCRLAIIGGDDERAGGHRGRARHGQHQAERQPRTDELCHLFLPLPPL
jgi:hypothetical protein